MIVDADEAVAQEGRVERQQARRARVVEGAVEDAQHQAERQVRPAGVALVVGARHAHLGVDLGQQRQQEHVDGVVVEAERDGIALEPGGFVERVDPGVEAGQLRGRGLVDLGARPSLWIGHDEGHEPSADQPEALVEVLG